MGRWRIEDKEPSGFFNPWGATPADKKTCPHPTVTVFIGTNRGYCKRCDAFVRDVQAMTQQTFVFDNRVSGNDW